MIYFRNYNVNPKGRKVGDCVVRAIAYASCQSWEETLTGLFNVAIKVKSEIACKDNYEKYLDQIGFVKHKQPKKPDGKKYQAREITQLIDTDKYDVVISVANHLTCADGSYLIDIWDCGKKTISNYYTRLKTDKERPANCTKTEKHYL